MGTSRILQMTRLWLLGLFLGLTACSATVTEPASSASLPDLGPAPELTNDTWLNVDAPLRLADLRGKVVIIDMWTLG
jgi:hypothetical protein